MPFCFGTIWICIYKDLEFQIMWNICWNFNLYRLNGTDSPWWADLVHAPAVSVRRFLEEIV